MPKKIIPKGKQRIELWLPKQIVKHAQKIGKVFKMSRKEWLEFSVIKAVRVQIKRTKEIPLLKSVMKAEQRSETKVRTKAKK